MDKDRLVDFLLNNFGKILGTFSGFILGVFLLTLGFFKTLLLSLCMIIGYFFGKKIDNKEKIEEYVIKLLNIYKRKKED